MPDYITVFFIRYVREKMRKSLIDSSTPKFGGIEAIVWAIVSYRRCVQRFTIYYVIYTYDLISDDVQRFERFFPNSFLY